MSNERVGFNLAGIPRNDETEYYFRVAAHDGELMVLSLDDIYEVVVAEELGYRYCDSHLGDEVFNPLLHCYLKWEGIVKGMGAKEAVKKYVGEDQSSMGNYLFNVSGAKRMAHFYLRAQEVLEKYQAKK